jgi:hypothetical protein
LAAAADVSSPLTFAGVFLDFFFLAFTGSGAEGAGGRIRSTGPASSEPVGALSGRAQAWRSEGAAIPSGMKNESC